MAEVTNYKGAEPQQGAEPPTGDGHLANQFEDGPMNPTQRRWIDREERQRRDESEQTRVRVEAEQGLPSTRRRLIEPIGGIQDPDQTENPDVRGTRRLHPPEA